MNRSFFKFTKSFFSFLFHWFKNAIKKIRKFFLALFDLIVSNCKKYKKSIYKALGFLIPIFITFFIYFEPDVDVMVDRPLVSRNANHTPFVLSNNGKTSIRNININYSIKNIVGIEDGESVLLSNLIYSNYNYFRPILEKNKSVTFYIDFKEPLIGIAKNQKTSLANIEIDLSYKWLIFNYNDIFKFKALTNEKFEITWYPELE